MKSTINSEFIKGLDNAIREHISSILSSLAGSGIDVSVAETGISSPEDIVALGQNLYVVSGFESNSGFQFGLISDLAFLSSTADKMLLGSGEVKTTLDDLTKESISELGGHFFSSIKDIYKFGGAKLRFNVDSVVDIKPGLIKTDSLYQVNLNISSAGQNHIFTIFFDKRLLDYAENFSKVDNSDSFTMSGKMKTHGEDRNIDMMLDIEVPVSIRMGTSSLFLKDILGLGPGNVVELEQNADELIDLTVNNRVIARGEVVIVDGYFGFRIREILSKEDRIKNLRD